MPVAVFVISTVAFGTKAPLGSATVPVRLPSIACAKTTGTIARAASTTNAITSVDLNLEIIFRPPLEDKTNIKSVFKEDALRKVWFDRVRNFHGAARLALTRGGETPGA